MPLTVAAALVLARSCAPSVAPQTLLSLAHAESGLDPLVIGVNGSRPRSMRPPSRDAAAAAARRLLAERRDFDLGLAQINVRNLARLGLSLDAAFDPCANLAAGARILTENYLAARRRLAAPQAALAAALSTYNTGDPERGVRNGYVARVYRAAAQVTPALRPAGLGEAETASKPPPPAGRPADPPPGPRLNVFERAPSSTLVWRPPPPAEPASLPLPPDLLPGDPS